MTTLNDLLASVADIARDLSFYPCGLAGFAYSADTLDQWHAQAFRDAAAKIGKDAVDAGLSDAEIRAIRMALAYVCDGDEYAKKEVAGRFLSIVRRYRAIKAIGRHPRRAAFDSLVRAVERGRFTAKQWEFAKKLAAEVGVSV